MPLLLNADTYEPHSEATISVSNAKGPITLHWEWEDDDASFTCSVVDPNGVVVNSKSYDTYDCPIDIPGDGRLYTVVWAAQFDYDKNTYPLNSDALLRVGQTPTHRKCGS